jgi:hypothetical protein
VSKQVNKLSVSDLFSLERYARERPAFRSRVLIPDGSNWKVTLLIEYPDESERRRELAMLKGIEDRCWVQVVGHERVFAIADEDLERENEEKTSAVHFLRFELTPPMIASLRGGTELALGIEHEHYEHVIRPDPEISRASLLADFS